MNTRHFASILVFALTAGVQPVVVTAAQKAPAPAPAPAPARPPRPTPPARDPHTPGYVEAKELPDGAVPPPDAEGNFIIGPTHTKAAEMTAPEGAPQGVVHE